MSVVTSIDIVQGQPGVHITVADQNGNPLPPSNITWDLTSASPVLIEPDATGFNFTANGVQAKSAVVNTIATYNGPGNPNQVIGPTLTINLTVPVVAPSVTALQYMSP